jgi:hypothetical protein
VQIKSVSIRALFGENHYQPAFGYTTKLFESRMGVLNMQHAFKPADREREKEPLGLSLWITETGDNTGGAHVLIMKS